jgi:hypothetical protein
MVLSPYLAASVYVCHNAFHILSWINEEVTCITSLRKPGFKISFLKKKTYFSLGITAQFAGHIWSYPLWMVEDESVNGRQPIRTLKTTPSLRTAYNRFWIYFLTSPLSASEERMSCRLRPYDDYCYCRCRSCDERDNRQSETRNTFRPTANDENKPRSRATPTSWCQIGGCGRRRFS